MSAATTFYSGFNSFWGPLWTHFMIKLSNIFVNGDRMLGLTSACKTRYFVLSYNGDCLSSKAEILKNICFSVRTGTAYTNFREIKNMAFEKKNQ